MLRKMSDLTKFSMQATDGEIGSVHDFYFDDQEWNIRYMVADTSSWLFGRRVLISPTVLGAIEREPNLVDVHLTKEQIENSPDVDLEKPVSRQQELDLSTHYGWSSYWAAPQAAVTGTGAMGAPVVPVPVAVDLERSNAVDEEKKHELLESDPTLRSSNEVVGYHIQATGDSVGHVEGFFVDERDWTIRYMLVDTRNWLPGRKVLISPSWINRVSWQESTVFVDISRERIENSPEYTAETTVDRNYETELYRYYGHEEYWRL